MNTAEIAAASIRNTFSDLFPSGYGQMLVMELDDRWVRVADDEDSWLVDGQIFDSGRQEKAAKSADRMMKRCIDDGGDESDARALAYGRWLGGHNAADSHYYDVDTRNYVSTLLDNCVKTVTVGGW